MPHSFTARHIGRAREIITDVHVSEPINGGVTSVNDSRIHKTSALWDTGATGSVVTAAMAKRLGLKPVSLVQVRHAGGVTLQNVYLVDIYLPNNLRIRAVKVTECPDTVGDFSVIVGMDIISLGDFAFTNVGGKSVFSFRIPSTEEIDYVDNARGIVVSTPYMAPKTQERNERCSCGSGKKYKNCCGK
jgi:hypothetical protein